jgi:hypothetical protein
MQPSSTNRQRTEPIVAYVAPFALFLALSFAETWEGFRDHYAWIYTLKIVAVLGLWWRYRRAYPAVSTVGMGTALWAGVAGFLLWIGLAIPRLEATLFEYLPAWLVTAERVALDPFEGFSSTASAWGFVAIRFTGLALVVPLIEEVFWRGFLIRYLVKDDFESVPLGQYTLFSFVVVTLLFAAVHVELVAALAWGAGINVLLYRTRNLWACILAHAVTNALLGVYILVTGSWFLW